MESIIELRHLKTLLALEETGSVSLAAQRVFLTQSALSHQIRTLENYYETPLFERKSNPLRFTPAGARLLKLARDLLPQVPRPNATWRRLSKAKRANCGWRWNATPASTG